MEAYTLTLRGRLCISAAMTPVIRPDSIRLGALVYFFPAVPGVSRASENYYQEYIIPSTRLGICLVRTLDSGLFLRLFLLSQSRV